MKIDYTDPTPSTPSHPSPITNQRGIILNPTNNQTLLKFKRPSES